MVGLEGLLGSLSNDDTFYESIGPQGDINHLLPRNIAKGGLIFPIENLQF